MATSSSPRFTELQGQYLAFIHTYELINARPPAEADMQRFFGVTAPSVHNMIVELDLIRFGRQVCLCSTTIDCRRSSFLALAGRGVEERRELPTTFVLTLPAS